MITMSWFLGLIANSAVPANPMRRCVCLPPADGQDRQRLEALVDRALLHLARDRRTLARAMDPPHPKYASLRRLYAGLRLISRPCSGKSPLS